MFTANAKTVNYLIAADGNPWVWVLGEDEDEKQDFYEVLKSKCVTAMCLRGIQWSCLIEKFSQYLDLCSCLLTRLTR